MTPTRLHEHRVTAAPEPEGWVVFLHGILGSGANWAGFARRLVEARPHLGALLLDLRLHGRSDDGTPPHTVEAAARDVAHHLEEREIRPRVLSGHSFGSKVAFTAATLGRGTPDSIWLLDADPGPRPEAAGRTTVLRVIETLRSMPSSYPEREAFTNELVDRGFSAGLAGWLGKNLVRAGGELHLQLDLDAIEAILEDYHATDLWPRLLHAPCPVHCVVGGRSDVFSPGARERLEREAGAGRLLLHHLPSAGHWVHVDAPKGLLDAFLTAL